MLTPAVFFISFIIRLLFVPLPGFKADIAYWKWWGMSAAHDGISGPLIHTAYNYPSFYLYILKFTSHLYEFLTGFNFKLDPNSAVFWSDTNFLYLLLIKLPYIMADIGIGILIYKIVKMLIKNSKLETLNSKHILNSNFQNTKRFGAWGLKFFSLFRISNLGFRIYSHIPLLAASLYLFNPVVIYNSSIWGQTDSVGAFLVLLSFYFLLKKRFSLLAVFAAVAFFMKVQTVIFLPILFLGIVVLSSRAKFSRWRTKSRDLSQINSVEKDSSSTTFGVLLGMTELIKSLWVFTAAAIVINLPFLLSHTMGRVFEVMYSSQAYFPYVSMNAYNLWWLIFGKASSSFWDQNLIAGLVSFKTMGLVLFGSVYVITVANILRVSKKSEGGVQRGAPKWGSPCGNIFGAVGRQDPLIENFLGSFILISFAFFLLLTQMHERYLFPIFAFFPILIGVQLTGLFKKDLGLMTYDLRIITKYSSYVLSLISYVLLSITTLLNLHQVMIMNYPDNTLPFLPNTFSETLTRVIAFINIIIFVILFWVLIKDLFVKQNFKTKMLSVICLLFTVLCLLLTVSLPKLYLYSRPIVYLSDLSPKVAYQGYGTLQKDKSVDGNWLSSLYYFFNKGLGTHANSQIVYDIGKRYKYFTTDFGVDTEANEAASVVFIIKGDGKTLFTSSKMTRFSFPGFAKVDVAGVKNLELDVTDAGDGINSDHADWLEAKLYK